jgi:hypothetical protein
MADPVACNLGDPERARRLAELERTLFSGAFSVQELADGFAFAFPNGRVWLERLTAFIADEQECCPFFRFELAVEAVGPIVIRLTGPAGTKDLIAAQFLPMLAGE